jgi:DNA-binding MarR family transcriptional regulator
MNDWDAFDTCLRLNHAHARLRRKLDDELGIRHGLSFADFVLLRALVQVPQGLTAQALQEPLGVQPSDVVRKVIALEKSGWLTRVSGAEGQRRIQLRAPGHGLVSEAVETVAAVCAAALAAVPRPAPAESAVLEALCESPALAIR